MKSILPRLLFIVFAFVLSGDIQLYADAPNYRGKVILVVDQTMATNQLVSTNIDRLKSDLVGDGWRVLTLDVTRGLNIQDGGWFQTNGPEVRQVRALIQADYKAAPSDVKQVFLIGHVPVPYSGYNAEIVGNHYAAPEPADSFYGEMNATYWSGGWSDDTFAPPSTNNLLFLLYYFTNYPSDGVFDPTDLPLPMQLGVGRVDFQNMPNLGVDEPTVTSRYLNKDHDFRWGNFAVQRRAYVTQENPFFYINDLGLDEAFGGENVFTNVNNGLYDWFPEVGITNYLIGYSGGYGFPTHADGSGSTYYDGNSDYYGHSSLSNNFVDDDSRVVFVHFSGSAFGAWECTNDFLRAPLANSYDPSNGRYGYGLTATWCWEHSGDPTLDDFALDENSLTNRAMGATIGEALFKGYTKDVNHALMGDPTLRLHTVLPPANLAVSGSSNEVELNWTASSDSDVLGYNTYWAPTQNGPYSILNTNGLIESTSFEAPVPSSGVPANFYMVRAVKLETVPIGSYTNMSEGVVATNSTFTSYLSIISGPVNGGALVDTEGYTNNAAAFTVDAVGINTNGSEQLNYQWYDDGTALTDGARISGSTTRALLIGAVQTNDMGSYYVIVSLADGSAIVSNAPVWLTVGLSNNPTANNDLFSVIRNTPTDLDVLSNDTSTLSTPYMQVVGLSPLTLSGIGTIVIGSSNTNVHFVPTTTFLGSVSFSYTMTDGAGSGQATANITVIPNPSDGPPVVSTIINQSMVENTTISLPFTANDGYTRSDDLTYVATSSNGEIIPDYDLSLYGSGSNRVLQISGGVDRVGTVTITLMVKDYDLQSTTNSFQVTILPAPGSPQMGAGMISSNAFTFGLSGPSGSYWNVYNSSDLTNWSQAGGVILGASGTNIFVDNSVACVSNRFYMVSDGNFCSAAIGFVRIVEPQGAALLIGNPLDAWPDDTLNTVFAQSSLPNGTIITKYTRTATFFYTNSSGVWLPNGNAILDSGGCISMDAPGTNTFTLSFVGLVREGWDVEIPSFNGVNSYVSSPLPVAGGVQTVLGYVPQSDSNGDFDTIFKEDDSVWQYVGNYDTNDYPAGWADQNGDPTNEPAMNLAEGFIIQNNQTNNEYWTGNYSPCSQAMTCATPGLTNGVVSSNSFSVGVSGPPGSYWGVYDSTDLTNWTLLGGVTMSAAGTNVFTDGSIAGVTNRFYKLSNGDCCSVAAGFARITVTKGSPSWIGNPLDAWSGNTFNSVFAQSTFPSGTVVYKEVPGSGIFYYTNSSGVWLPNGNATLGAGEMAFCENPTNNPYTLTLVGQVREGWNVTVPPFADGYFYFSSPMPLTGGVQTVLGYHPEFEDYILKQDGSQWEYLGDYDTNDYPMGWADGDGNPTNEPALKLGEGFLIQNNQATNEYWTGNYSPCSQAVICTAPGLTNGVVSSNSFSMGVSGPPGSYWGVYDSTDLTNWTLLGGVTMSAAGTNVFTDGSITGVTNRFYKLSNGNCCSVAAGFVRVTVPTGSPSWIGNPLDAWPDDTFNSLFAQSALPNGTIISREIPGTGFFYYTNLSGVWLPNGNATLGAGEMVFCYNLTTNAYTVSFVGQVRESWNVTIPSFNGGSYYYFSSPVAVSGGVHTVLGYNPEFGDNIVKPNGVGWEYVGDYDTNTYPTGWADFGGNPTNEPTMNLGEGFLIQNSQTNNEYWMGNYSPCH